MNGSYTLYNPKRTALPIFLLGVGESEVGILRKLFSIMLIAEASAFKQDLVTLGFTDFDFSLTTEQAKILYYRYVVVSVVPSTYLL